MRAFCVGIARSPHHLQVQLLQSQFGVNKAFVLLFFSEFGICLYDQDEASGQYGYSDKRNQLSEESL